LRHLHDLTQQHEGHRQNPWAVSDAPEDFVKRQLRGLVGFEIQVTSIEGTWKVSQNKSDADKAGVTSGLLDENTSNANEISRSVTERSQ
ncbi:MAG: FMN-binding negative transcriptional regulator, partial [Marinomonas sp.]